LAKGTKAQFLDKGQDAWAVIRLVDKLQKAILIYQVCANDCDPVRVNTSNAGVSRTINPQPDIAVNSMFLHVTSVLKLTSCLLKVLIWCISETQ